MADHAGVGVSVVPSADTAWLERPAATPGPRRVVDPELGPEPQATLAVDADAELRDRSTNLLIEFFEWSASPMRRTRRCPGRIDLPQGDHERREIDCRVGQVVDGAVGALTGQPLAHGPVEGVALGRRAASWSPSR